MTLQEKYNKIIDMKDDRLYRLMMHFAHSIMIIYDKTIISHKEMTVKEFYNKNKNVIDRVFEEGLSIMNYELSYHQMMVACSVYLEAKYYPSDVLKTNAYKREI